MTKIKAKETGAPVKSGKGKGKPGKGKKVQQEEKENAEPNVMETDDKESTDQDSDSDATNAFDLEDPMEGSPQAESTKVEKPKARVMTATRKVQKRKRITKTTRAGLVFSVPRLLKKMRKSKLAKHIQIKSAVYIAAALDYLVAEIFELAGEAAKANNKVRIIPRHIMLAIKQDVELNELLRGVIIPASGVIPHIAQVLLPKKTQKKATEA